MVKKLFLLFLFCNILAYGNIHIKIFQPLRFSDINTQGLASDEVIGKGILQIQTDDLKEDCGKKLVFLFPERGLMTNRKKWVKIDEYYMDKGTKEIIIDRETIQVPFYAKLSKDNFRNYNEDPEIVEGDYIGYVPIIVSQYGKLEK
ncbi:hypothetical protein [Cetobacterium sp. SF1]|uniref:hypothetical protein n=1 Tax=unclassified Cetobacterium TaxID=2630983 RepID=UPI003CF707A0